MDKYISYPFLLVGRSCNDSPIRSPFNVAVGADGAVFIPYGCVTTLGKRAGRACDGYIC